MAKKTPVDKLSQAMAKILEEYGEDVKKNTGIITKKFAQKGANAVKQNAQAQGWTGGYDKGWTSQFEENRTSMQGVIFNKDVPGLPHLLEKSHALRQGGRTNPHPHIAPVEEKIADEYYKAVVKSL